MVLAVVSVRVAYWKPISKTHCNIKVKKTKQIYMQTLPIVLSDNYYSTYD